MKKQILIIMLILLTLLTAIPVQAQTITMSNPNSNTQQDILVYWPNGTLYGSYNTTSIIDLNANDSYIFTLKPQYSNPLSDPVGWMTSSFSYVSTFATPIAIIVFLIGLLYMGRR